jgi:hypothetical protein
MQKSVLGLDIGGVIRCRLNLDQPEPKVLVEGVTQAVGELMPLFDGQVVIVSRRDRASRMSTLAWLLEQSFFQLTGVSPAAVTFVDERWQKANVCRELGVTHFVDNRLEVFEHMQKIEAVRHRYCLRLEDNPEDLHPVRKVGSVHLVYSWSRIVELISRTFVSVPSVERKLSLV